MKNQSKISQIFLQNTSLSVKQTKFVNYMKNSSCRTPSKLPGTKHRENTCLICTACWLLPTSTQDNVSIKNDLYNIADIPMKRKYTNNVRFTETIFFRLTKVTHASTSPSLK